MKTNSHGVPNLVSRFQILWSVLMLALTGEGVFLFDRGGRVF